MKNIKTYRAETLREALEKIKKEMGENALVLSHKQVCTGGFLGFRKRDMIEVCVQANNVAPVRAANTDQTSKVAAVTPARSQREQDFAQGNILGLNNSNNSSELSQAASVADIALNIYQEKLDQKKSHQLTTNSSISPSGNQSVNPSVSSSGGFNIAGFAARAYNGITGANGVTAATPPPQQPLREMWREERAAVTSALNGSARNNGESSERIKRESPLNAASPAASTSNSMAAMTGAAITSELQRLRAEIREMKFSMSTFSRSSSRHNDLIVDLDQDLEIYDTPYYEGYLELISMGLNSATAREAVQAARQWHQQRGARGGNVAHQEIIYQGLTEIMTRDLKFAEDLLSFTPGLPGAPLATVFIGPTGVGKTTTIAKLAAHASTRTRQRIELITLDTYRIAAVEQLKTYAEIIGVGCHAARSVAELDELIQRFAGKAIVFIDTAGRNPNDLADQMDLANYLHSSCDLLKCLVLQATTNAIDAQIAAKKFALYGSDQLVITKLDETARPGNVYGLIADAGLPLTYICAGQRVPEDIEKASAATLAAHILRATLLANAA